MNRKSSANRKTELSLRRETMRQLTSTELKLVVGGRVQPFRSCGCQL